MLALVLAPLAWATDAPSEEIYVWGDPFARWEKRWYVQTEVQLPQPRMLASWSTNHELWIRGYQLRATLSCNRDFPLGPRRQEVSCELEDVGLVVLPSKAGRHDAEIVEQADATLTGARFQLQVAAAGDVPNIDLEDAGIARTRDQRQRQEQLRQMISRAIVPFHLSLPEVVYDGAQWIEYDSRLLSLPVGASRYVASGAKQGNLVGGKVVHFLNRYGDHLLVQSIGKASVQTSFAESEEGLGLPSNIHMLELHGVALIDPDDGVMVERTWVVRGELTASSPSVLSGGGYLHHGAFRMLGPDDHPDVGSSKVVAARDWVPMP